MFVHSYLNVHLKVDHQTAKHSGKATEEKMETKNANFKKKSDVYTLVALLHAGRLSTAHLNSTDRFSVLLKLPPPSLH